MEESEKILDKLKKAMEDGNVETMTDNGNILLTDWTGSGLMLIEETHGMADFGISAFDGGGFIGCHINKDQWETMKEKIDTFLIKKFKG
jgi:hypothetical protein